VKFFSELEGTLERLIEGLFREKLKGSLQSADITKKLAREMRDHRRTGINQIFVPNRFEICLSTEEYAAIAPLAERLTHEFKEYIKNKAQEQHYTILGPVEVIFKEEEEIPAVQLKINSYFDETEELVTEETLRYYPLKADIKTKREHHAFIEVVEGFNRGKIHKIDGSLAVIGRRDNCDIYLPDESVSRKHAVIIRTGNKFFVKDQTSTNGTLVNGKRIEQTELVIGDTITVGRVVLVFKVE